MNEWMDCWVGGRKVNPLYVTATAFPTDPLARRFSNHVMVSVAHEAPPSKLFGDFLKMHIPPETESLSWGLTVLHF